MAPSAATPSSLHASSENNLQPFFVMQKGPQRRPSASKTRRKIGFSSSHNGPADSEEDDDTLNRLRYEAFDLVWSQIESSIKDVLRKINRNVFDELYHWVCQSFQTIRSSGRPSYIQATRPYPFATDTSLKQVYTALVCTRNMEFVDDLLTFEDLGHHLRSYGSYVAKLSSSDFSANIGISGCLRSLLHQFLTPAPDAADLSILASWYNEQREDKPVIIIIEDMERCCGKILSAFILMLSEWVIKVPVMLIMGVSTTFDATRIILPSDSLQMLRPFKFALGSPAERMDAVVEAILVRPCSRFNIGHKVALFLKNHFLNQDGTLTAFIRALKIACVLHFSVEPVSFLSEYSTEGVIETCMESHAYGSRRKTEHTVESLAHGLTALMKSQQSWSAVLLALHGDPRRRVQSDLLESSKLLCCSCCTAANMSSLHDTSVMYLLAQEHGDLINLHDWYQSFKEVSSLPITAKKKKSKYSPSPKKRKQCVDPLKQSEAVIQGRFCRAIMELQIAGLLRMPSKRRPDHVQRVALGL